MDVFGLWYINMTTSIPPMRNQSSANAYFKNRSNKRVNLEKDHFLLLNHAVDQFL